LKDWTIDDVCESFSKVQIDSKTKSQIIDWFKDQEVDGTTLLSIIDLSTLHNLLPTVKVGPLAHLWSHIQQVKTEYCKSDEGNPKFEGLKHKWALLDPGDHPMKGIRDLDNFDLRNVEVIRLLNGFKAKRIEEDNADKVDVLFRLEVTELDNINTQEETASIGFIVTCYWKEECLVGDDDTTGHTIYPENYKNGFGLTPKFEVLGEVELEQLVEDKEMFFMEFLWSDYGIVCQKRQYRGTIRFPMNLRNFPFDVQTLKLVLTSGWYDSLVEFHNFTSEKEIETMTSLVRLHEWEKAGNFKVYDKLFLNVTEGMSYSQMTAELALKRNTTFYVQKIMALQVLISLLLFPFFALPNEDLNDRLANTLTLLLAAIAFNFTVAGELPKISYSSLLDYFFQLNYCFLGLTAFSHLLLYFVESWNEMVALILFISYIVAITCLLTFSYGLRAKSVKEFCSTTRKGTSGKQKKRLI